MKCEYGYCINCEKEIAPKCDSCDIRKPGPEYTEVHLNWSNGSKMSTAVCIPCSQGPIWKADKEELKKAIWLAWDKQGGNYDREVTIVD